MSKMKDVFLKVALGLTCLLNILTAHAQTYVVTQVPPQSMMSPPQTVIVAPPPREVIVVPPNAVYCKNIPATYVHHHQKWIDAHRVCTGRQGQIRWTSAHWECNRFNWKGVCKKWDWIPSTIVRR